MLDQTTFLLHNSEQFRVFEESIFPEKLFLLILSYLPTAFGTRLMCGEGYGGPNCQEIPSGEVAHLSRDYRVSNIELCKSRRL